ncbi:hypothetical protein BL248_22700 [Ralstonia solanacearum]|nr:hypothetical protein BL248_22700 [Ralstonia solanacearum]
MSGREAIDELGEGYTLELKAPDSLNPGWLSQLDSFKLNEMVGHEITVFIELDGMGAAFVGAGKREITGVISRARYLRGEGRSQLYAVTIQPWPYLMTLSKNYRAFQNKALPDILGDIFAAYPYPVEMRLKPENFPVRDYQVQFGLSDFDYFRYLTQEFGVTWHMEYAEGRQRLVLCDGLIGHQMQPSTAYQALSFYRDGFRIDAEHIERFELADQLTSGYWRTNDYDYTKSLANLASAHHDPRDTAESSRKVYEWPGDYSQPKAGTRQDQDPRQEGERLARIRMEVLRSTGSRALGEGNLRAVVPGYVFALQNHPHQAANREYLVLSAELDLEEVAEESGQSQQWRCRVSFEAHPISEPYRPQRTVKKPNVGGPITATVVGPKDTEVHTDSLSRIKVLPHFEEDKRGNENSSLWVRVSSAWAGMEFGAQHVPRVGDEVLLSFEGGDPDRPVVTGRVVNEWRGSPWELPSQFALSGFRSRELGGSNRSNHLVMDDTPKQIQTQLSSDHQLSQLSLGYLTRIQDRQGRKDRRGEGFELRTDGHGVARAAQGLLLTTEARPNAEHHHKDLAETAQRLKQAQDLHDSLASLAQNHYAQDSAAGQTNVAAEIKRQNEEIRGSGEPSSEIAAPHLVLSSPAGINTSSAKSTHVASNDHTAITSGKHLSLSSGKSLLASAAERISLFAHRLGMKLIAASGKIEIQAQKDNIEIVAHKVLKLISAQDKIEIGAMKEIVLNAGGSFIRITPSSITHGTSGDWTVHSNGTTHDGPATLTQSFPPTVGDGPNKRKFTLHYADSPDHRLKGYRYRIHKDDGSVHEGVTNAKGETNLVQSDLLEVVKVEILGKANG